MSTDTLVLGNLKEIIVVKEDIVDFERFPLVANLFLDYQFQLLASNW